MRILVDYRPALRERTGVGEYVHQLVRAYAATYPGEVTVFTSSWKDRPPQGLSAELNAPVIDRRVPVRLLNLLWHRTAWPPAEVIAGRFDVVHAAHPLLIPARRAAQVVTIHDLYFLSDPDRTSAEIRRDYVPLVRPHARRAHAVITSTAYGKGLISGSLGVPEERIYVCPPGAPTWRTLGQAPNAVPSGYLVFLGTLEPRKNVGALRDAYERLLARMPAARPLVMAGHAKARAAERMARIEVPPLAGRVRHVGYVPDDEREALYAGACALVLPSLDEGFGLPALEAMSAGVPVVASSRGALPEVVGSAGTLIDPADVEGLTAALEQVISDGAFALACAEAGLMRARAFTWNSSAATLHRAYADAMERRRADD